MKSEFEFDVFLSYSSKDKPRVRRLAEQLRDTGLRVWFDEWIIKPGADIYLAIEHGLEASRVQVLCMSPRAFDSDWVGLERSTVLFRDPKNIERRFIPILIAECEIPDTLQRYRYLDFRRDTEIVFQELLFALNPELAAAYQEGTDSLKNYLQVKQNTPVVLNEAKLIVVGSSKVGKSCLIDALCNNEWVENNTERRKIEIRKITLRNLGKKNDIFLNAWDSGSSQFYWTAQQLFFSPSAIYLVVWKPREGSQQGLVREWIRLIKRRAPDAKILVVATHAGPQERQPDLDRQEVWNEFGKETVVDFLHVDSKPDKQTGERMGIIELKKCLLQIANSLPEMGHVVAENWQNIREIIQKSNKPFISKSDMLKIGFENNSEEEHTRLFINVENRLGRLFYYEHDHILKDIIVLQPHWLIDALQIVFDETGIQDGHGLVTFSQLSTLWSNKLHDSVNNYPTHLHQIFLRFMERFDFCFPLTDTNITEWPQGNHLIASLVPYERPDPLPGWTGKWVQGDEEQIQICKISDIKSGTAAPAEGIIPKLIVRLHKYSLGRNRNEASVHWQRGMILEDEFKARALIEHIGHDIRITVRAPIPEGFLNTLTREVKWVVEKGWPGLRCNIMIPCPDPSCDSGLFEVESLLESKQKNKFEYPCPKCNTWHNIISLLRHTSIIIPSEQSSLYNQLETMIKELHQIRKQLGSQHTEALERFDNLDTNTNELLIRFNSAYEGLLKLFTNESKDGPRLFSLIPVKRSGFNPKEWTSEKFKLILWCEHIRLPLPVINGKDSTKGIYEIELTRDWFKKSAPLLKLMTSALSLALPVAASGLPLAIDKAAYDFFKDSIDFGKDIIDATLSASDKAELWKDKGDDLDLPHGVGIRAENATLRELQSFLKEKDPGFGGLVRVMNKRQEFLWVHEKYASEY